MKNLATLTPDGFLILSDSKHINHVIKFIGTSRVSFGTSFDKHGNVLITCYPYADGVNIPYMQKLCEYVNIQISFTTNLHMLEVKFLPATNHLPARIKITSKRFKQSIYVNFDFENNNQVNTAIQHLEKIGFNIVGSGEFGGDISIIASDTFKPLRMKKATNQ